MRRRREPALRSSPFVVLSDMTIGLTFFFAVFSTVASLANSQAFAVAQRTERQKGVREELVRAFVSQEPGTTSKVIEKQAEGDKYTELRRPDGGVMAQIWENGNFQRITIIEPVYRSAGSAVLRRRGQRLYESLAPVLKAHAPDFAYIFIHGIAERGEGDALDLSRLRADGVSAILRDLGVIKIARDGERARDFVETKYAIAYGTGNELYTSGAAPSGRVDLVLFYKEAAGETPKPSATLPSATLP